MIFFRSSRSKIRFMADATLLQQIMIRGGPVTITPASFNVGHRQQEDSCFRRNTYPEGPAMSGLVPRRKEELV